MTTTELLTLEEIYDVEASAGRGEEPAVVIGRLEAIVDQRRHDDPLDAAHILVVAARLAERHRDLPTALRLAERAMRAEGPEGYHHSSRTLRATLLVRMGRADEGWAELEGMRPQLLTDPDAVVPVCEALVDLGHGDLAVTWATDAFETLKRRWAAPGALDTMNVADSAVMVALAAVRHDVRRELDLPHDDIDELADEFAADHDDEADDDEVAVLVWPEREFQKGLARWPAFGEAYGTWDGHRELTERRLQRMSGSGTTLGVLIGSVDELARFAGSDDPMDSEVRGRYADHIARRGAGRPWPPGRNLPCWCGSGQKYKRCCLPRSRS